MNDAKIEELAVSSPDAWRASEGGSQSRRESDLAMKALRTLADTLAHEVARLEQREQESAGRIRRLRAALRMVLDDLTCRVKTQEPVSEALRDFESVRREVSEALED